MTDYWLSKMFFDLQTPAVAAEYRADRGKVIARYPLADDVKQALRADNVVFLSKRVNPYLLRYYFGAAGMTDAVFLASIREEEGNRTNG